MFQFGLIALITFGVCFGGTLPEKCGQTTKQGDFPWLAQIRKENDQMVCSGFIINDRFIVTAGHCANNPNTKIKTVVVGEGDKEKQFLIDSVYIHPDFTKRNNDISLIKLKDHLQFDEHVSPICLTNKESRDKAETDSFTVSGWGFLSQEKSRLSIKTKAVDVKKCSEELKISLGINHLCASGENLCDTLSGNPLMYKAEDKWYAEGITTTGTRCPSPKPTVYTNINQYIDFIVTTVSKN